MMKRLESRKLSLDLAPAEVVRQLSHLSGLIFLDSSGNLTKDSDASFSIIVAEPVIVIKGKHGAMSEVREALAGYESASDEAFPVGGAFGWIDYEGDFCFGIYESCLIFDHEAVQWHGVGDLNEKLLGSELEEFQVKGFTAHMGSAEYIEGVEKIQEYIKAGDIYQVNLTHKFSSNVGTGSLLALYERLRKASPAPMSAYMHLGDREVLSSSPETFLNISGRHIETRPIKGTRPRYHDELLDAASVRELLESEKEQSELVMITDLERNDLGQVCEFGSVKGDQLLQHEVLEHVFHLVSKVSGTLRAEVDHLEAVSACFPGGSITGAPKKRAMEIINELEPDPRGLYTGAIGYIGFNQVSQFNIVIRTLVRNGSELSYHVGAGIVADSDPAAEYAETLDKAKGIRTALASSS